MRASRRGGTGKCVPLEPVTSSEGDAASTYLSSTGKKIVVASTVMLSFISFWRAAAIVLCDLGSSAFYAGGIAEGYVGKSAPWFILGIMLFSYAVRAVYVESCAMFVRGGVYRVVREALGRTLAVFAVSALMFDYVLTGPISGVTAGLYLAGLINDLLGWAGYGDFHRYNQLFAAAFTIAVTCYFWRKNVIGMHESSQKALRIMQITTIMVVTLILWCLVTMAVKGFQPVPWPSHESIRFGNDALGWLTGSAWGQMTFIAILVGLGHSLLAMSGEESLAQVHREIAAPKLKNLQHAGTVIFVYSLVFTSLVSFFAVMLIPDVDRGHYLDNLIGGLAMHMAGPLPLRLLFQAFVVVVGTTMLSGAVNTAIVGSNGVMNRVAEDGVLPGWFRHPHRKFGTTYRIIGFIGLLQITTILLTRGDLQLLGDAYAFGVVWSFTAMSLSMLVLRFKRPGEREWRVPWNVRVGGIELPIGLGLIFLTLFSLAVVNLFTKKVATVWGFGFTAAIFVMFELTERANRKRHKTQDHSLERFLFGEEANVRPGSVLVAVRNPAALDHLQRVLEKTDAKRMDIVVLTIQQDLEAEHPFNTDVAALFSRVVSMAEKMGKHVELMVVSSDNPEMAIVEIASRLKSSLVVMGSSPKMTPEEQAKRFGDTWERLPAPRPQLSLRIRDQYFNLGPHPPRLWPEDIDLLHRLWLGMTQRTEGHKLHHRDVVHIALRRLEQDFNSAAHEDILRELKP